ncbi:reverse transcriptase domain-containing protein [Tanacetum coccineum]
MLERLCGNEYYYFLDGFLGFFQIPITLEDQEKTTFTCPYRTFAYRQMSFGLYNAPVTFQRCMTTIFHDMVEYFMEVFMDDFSVFGNSFDCCLANLDRMLARCEETNLVLNWENAILCICSAKRTRNQGLLGGFYFSKDLTLRLRIKRADNLAADHLSRLENPDLGTFTEEEITDEFPDEHLMILKAKLNNDKPWYANYVNYIVGKYHTPSVAETRDATIPFIAQDTRSYTLQFTIIKLGFT